MYHFNAKLKGTYEQFLSEDKLIMTWFVSNSLT